MNKGNLGFFMFGLLVIIIIIAAIAMGIAWHNMNEDHMCYQLAEFEKAEVPQCDKYR